MRHLLLLIFSLCLFTACDKATFDTEGSIAASGEEANGFEVVTEEEEAEILGEEDTGDEGVNCEGDCPDDDGRNPDNEDDDDDDDECDGDCEDDNDGDHSCNDRKHDHKKGKKKKDKKKKESQHDKKKKNSMIGNECETCVICPKESFDNENIVKDHSCESELKSHKIHICKWPAGDESKEMTLCVAKASLQGLVRMRRQDRYFIGSCPSED